MEYFDKISFILEIFREITEEIPGEDDDIFVMQDDSSNNSDHNKDDEE